MLFWSCSSLKRIFFFKNLTATLFSLTLHNYSPMEGELLFPWINLKPLHVKIICVKIGWNSSEEVKKFKSNRLQGFIQLLYLKGFFLECSQELQGDGVGWRDPQIIISQNRHIIWLITHYHLYCKTLTSIENDLEYKK